MKKSRLKHIIRESIKELTEQATGGCTTPTNFAVNVPNGASNQAVNYTPNTIGNLTWFVCGAQTTGMWQAVPNAACCQAHGMPAQMVMNSSNQDPAQAVINAQNGSPGSNTGVNGLYARFEDCAMNCPGAYSPSNQPPQFSPCGDACWQGYHNFGVTTTPQSSGPTGVGIDRDAPERGEDTPTMAPTACDEFSRFTREEKSDICEECLTNPNSFPEFCECCDDSMIRERLQKLANIKK